MSIVTAILFFFVFTMGFVRDKRQGPMQPKGVCAVTVLFQQLFRAHASSSDFVISGSSLDLYIVAPDVR